MYKEMLELLTDNYNKDPNSNIGKLFNIMGDEIHEVKNCFIKLKEWKDIDKAQGKALERLGNNVLEFRSDREDDLYRQMIKTKIISNLSQGDIETINEVANALIGDSFLGIKETWSLSEFNNEPAGLILTMRNQAKILQTNAIDRAIAGGVGIKYILELIQDKDSIGGEEGSEKFTDSDIYIASALICGENITVYPWISKKIELNTKVTIAVGSSTGLEKVEVYPRKEVI